MHTMKVNMIYFEKKCFSNSCGLYFVIFSTLTSFNVPHHISHLLKLAAIEGMRYHCIDSFTETIVGNFYNNIFNVQWEMNALL